MSEDAIQGNYNTTVSTIFNEWNGLINEMKKTESGLSETFRPADFDRVTRTVTAVQNKVKEDQAKPSRDYVHYLDLPIPMSEEVEVNWDNVRNSSWAEVINHVRRARHMIKRCGSRLKAAKLEPDDARRQLEVCDEILEQLSYISTYKPTDRPITGSQVADGMMTTPLDNGNANS